MLGNVNSQVPHKHFTDKNTLTLDSYLIEQLSFVTYFQGAFFTEFYVLMGAMAALDWPEGVS